ncbi:MAG TPA: IS3 family transposase, partial [Acidimicrobiales bacterium]|nr:IS3 family transposase [Acidimicrobiales bacterium]
WSAIFSDTARGQWSLEQRRQMIDPRLELPVSDQCRLLSLARSTYYYEGASETPENLALMEIIDRLYLNHPENGSRMKVRVLARMGHVVNRKRVQRLMNLMGIRSLAPQKKTTVAHSDHYKYPYLLHGLSAYVLICRNKYELICRSAALQISSFARLPSG